MRLFILFGSVLVLALVAALVAPPYVDWDQFKSRFEEEAARTLGYPVKVNGKASVRLLPLPSVTFNDVEVGEGAADGTAEGESGTPFLTAKSLTLNFELAPLLKGDVIVFDMAVNRPRLDVRLDSQGRIDWPKRNVQPAGSRPVELSADNISLENIGLTNGVLRFRDARYDREIILKGIDATASAKAITGPWRAQGLVSHEGQRVRVGLSTGLLQPKGSMRVKLAVSPQAVPYDFEIDGPLAIADGKPGFTGSLRIRPLMKQDDRDLIVFRRPSAQEALPMRVEGDLTVSASGASIPAFKMDIGDRDDPYVVTGNGQAIFGEATSFRLRAEGQQINVERLNAGGSGSGSANAGKSLKERLAGLRQVIDKVPRFSVDGEVNLYLPAIVAGDTVIREVGMDLRPANEGDGWQVSNLTALLPGRTDLRANGEIRLGEDFGYSGDLIVASRQPSGFAKWMGAAADNGLLNLANAGFSAKARISETVADLQDLEIILGGKRLKGDLLRETVSSVRPRLKAKLEGDGVDYAQLTALFDLFAGAGQSGNASLGAHDLDLDLALQRLTVSGIDLDGVRGKIKWLSGDLTLEDLEIADLAGAKLTAEGELTAFPEKPFGKINGTLSAENSADVLRLMRGQMDTGTTIDQLLANPDLLAGTDLALSLNAGNSGYEGTVKGSVSGSRVEFRLTGDQLTKAVEEQNLDLRLVMDNDDAAPMLRQLGFDIATMPNAGRGAFRLVASGVLDRGLKTDAALTLRDGYVSASGLVSGKLGSNTKGLSGSLNVVAEANDLDPFILASGLAVPGFGQGESGSLKARLKFDQGSYSLEGLTSTIGSSSISGDVTLDAAAKPRPLLRGQLNLSELSVPMISDLVFAGTGQGDAGVEPVLSGMDAAIELSADQVSLPGSGPQALAAKTNMVVRDGDMTLHDISARYLGGTLGGTLSFSNSASARLLSGQLNMAGAGAAEVLQLAGFSKGISGQLDATGTFESAAENGGSLLQELTGSGSLSAHNVLVNGLGADAFGQLLARADSVEDDKVTDAAADLANEVLFSGSAGFEKIETSFNLSKGVLRADNVAANNPAMATTLSGRFDLTTREIDGDVQISYDAGKQAVLGATPEMKVEISGTAGETRRTSDVALLSTYLGMRVSERREREFEAQQAEILERQRLQRTARLYSLQETARRIAAEEEERIARLEREAEERRKREEALRKRQEIERARLEARLKAAQEEARRAAELEAARRAERQQRLDLLRKQAEEASRRLQESFTGNSFQLDPNPAPATPQPEG